jgi:hypothetical protein
MIESDFSFFGDYPYLFEGRFLKGWLASGAESIDVRGPPGGRVDIHCKAFTLTDATVEASNYGPAPSNGGVYLFAEKSVGLDNGNIFSDVYGDGKSGDIDIKTKSLSLLNGANITADIIAGEGDGGSITIQSDDALIDGGYFTSSGFHASRIRCSANDGQGHAGDMNLETENMTESNGGQIINVAFGSGDAGDIEIHSNDIRVDGGFEIIPFLSIITCQTQSSGNAGSLNLETENLTVSNGGQIGNLVFGSGDGGDVTIHATDVLVDGGFESATGYSLSAIFCQTQSSGNGGNLDMETESLTMSNDGVI